MIFKTKSWFKLNICTQKKNIVVEYLFFDINTYA